MTNALREDIRSKIESVGDDLHVYSPSEGGMWRVDFECDKCPVTGWGQSPDEAAVEALAELDILNWYADNSWKDLTHQQMTQFLINSYLLYFGVHPDHEYRGGYEARG